MPTHPPDNPDRPPPLFRRFHASNPWYVLAMTALACFLTAMVLLASQTDQPLTAGMAVLVAIGSVVVGRFASKAVEKVQASSLLETKEDVAEATGLDVIAVVDVPASQPIAVFSRQKRKMIGLVPTVAECLVGTAVLAFFFAALIESPVIEHFSRDPLGTISAVAIQLTQFVVGA